MLSVLRIENLAIVENLEVEFRPGLNVLTGETGAGKSIVLKAIELLTGRRAAGDLVRTGAERCTVEAIITVPDEVREMLSEHLPELREELTDEELLIRRVIDRSGRSKLSLNGQLTTAAMLQHLSPFLIDITGQHQQQTLLDPDRHLALLDSAGVPEIVRADVGTAYTHFALAQRHLETFLKDQNARHDYFARLTAEYEELHGAGIRLGLRRELEAEMVRLGSVEQLAATLSRCLSMIEESDENIESALRSLSTELGAAIRFDDALKEPLELVDLAATHLDEAKRSLIDYGSRLEADPDRLEELRGQISELARIERKYGKKEDDLVAYLERIRGELAAFEDGGLDERTLRERAAEAERVLRGAEERLTVERLRVAKILGTQVQDGLRQLGMKHAKFEVGISVAPSSPVGADHVEFLLTANPGEPLRPIQKIASGGELSRILLVLKTALNERNGALTQIFDEVDTGISGQVAQIVGAQLAGVARNAQVILVTHSPQIAAFAETHLVIAKSTTKDHTTTSITKLEPGERVQHLASMLGGKHDSPHFQHSAEELLRIARPQTFSEATASEASPQKSLIPPTPRARKNARGTSGSKRASHPE